MAITKMVGLDFDKCSLDIFCMQVCIKYKKPTLNESLKLELTLGLHYKKNNRKFLFNVS